MVNDEVTKVRVNGDGSTKTVIFAFKYLSDSSIKVYKIATDVTPEVATLQVLNTDYTVAAGSPQGGVVTFTTAPTVDEDGFVKLDEPYTQAVDIPSAGVFREEALEAGLDKPVLLCQQLREEVSRAIKLPETSLITSVAFGEPVADRALVWRDDGGGAWTVVSSASNPDDAATYAAAAAASAVEAAAQADLASAQVDLAEAQVTLAATQAGIATAAAGSVPSMASIFPVGTIYSNASDSRNPATIFGFTSTWVALEGVVVVGYKSGDANFGTPGATVGVASVTLTAAQSGLPAHTHSGIVTSGPGSALDNGNAFGIAGSTAANSAANASEAHTNIQPSLVAYAWKRTA